MSTNNLICNVCGVEISSPKLSTIGNQVVCSLACVGLLTSNKSDACDYCKKPVWKDNYYILNNKYYCREKCKNEMKRRSKFPEKNIRHIKQNIFPTNNFPLENSQQLREDVLKIFKDFKFDSIGDYSIDNRNKTPNYSNNISSVRTNDNSKYCLSKNNNHNKKSYFQKKYDIVKVKNEYRNPSNNRMHTMKNSTENNLKNEANSFRNKIDYSLTMKNNDDNETKGNNKFYRPNKTIIYKTNYVSNNNDGRGFGLRAVKNNNNSNKYNNHQVHSVYYKNS